MVGDFRVSNFREGTGPEAIFNDTGPSTGSICHLAVTSKDVQNAGSSPLKR